MVVKSKRGRRRYIVVRVKEGTLSDEGLLAALYAALSSAGVKSYKVFQFNGRMGILRVSGQDQRRAVEALNVVPNSPLETLRTSGTLRTLRERYFEPEDGQARAR